MARGPHALFDAHSPLALVVRIVVASVNAAMTKGLSLFHHQLNDGGQSDV